MRTLQTSTCFLALALLGATAAVAQHDHGAPQSGAPMMGAPSTAVAMGKSVSYASGSETVKSELFLPAGEQKKNTHPAIILIHEWWGLNDWVREQARDYASSGYVVLAVDLYRGQVATDSDMAHELSRGMPHDRARRDLLAAANYLRQRKDVGASGKIGTVGWCFGGGLALEFAIADPDLSAVVVNYGSLPTDDADLKKINAPVLGNFGAMDKGIPPSAVTAFQQQMQTLGKTVDVKDYDDAGHAFENEYNKAGYNAADAADAKARTKQFLARNLMGM